MTTQIPLAGYQKKFLRGRAHGLKPLVHVGKQGVTEAIAAAVTEQLRVHELIKVRFLDPDDKKGQAEELAQAVGAELAGLVGHVAILYRASDEPDGARIVLPTRES